MNSIENYIDSPSAEKDSGKVYFWGVVNILNLIICVIQIVNSISQAGWKSLSNLYIQVDFIFIFQNIGIHFYILSCINNEE